MTLTRAMGIDAAFPNASDWRKEHAAIYPRKGVFPSPTTTNPLGIAYAGTGWGISARAFGAAIKRGDSAYLATYGTALVANDAVVTNAWTINAAPASGSRIDVLCITVRDVTQGDSTAGTPNDGPGGVNRSSIPEFVVVTGTAGTPGTRPTVPNGYLEIAEVQVPSGASSAAGVTIIRTYPFAQVVGGMIYTNYQSEIATLSNPMNGDVALAIDTGTAWRYNGTRWGRYGQKVAGFEGTANETGSILNPGDTQTVATVAMPVPMMRGAVVRMFLSTYLYGPAAVDYAGYLRFVVGSTYNEGRRWHSRGRAGVLMPSAMIELKMPADLSGATNAAVRVTSDPASGGPMEIFNTHWSIVYDYLGE